jgi:sec-independent protein translocase protein TatA
MLGLDNPLHIAFILVLLLLVFGAKRLPEMGKSLGTGLRGFKDSLTGDAPPSALTEARTETPVEHPTAVGDVVRHVDDARTDGSTVAPDAVRSPVQPVA